MPFSAVIRPRSIGTVVTMPCGDALRQHGLELVDLAALNVEEEEIRRVSGNPAGNLAAQIGVDQRNGREQRQAKPERNHHRPRDCAGPVHVADGKPRGSRFDARRCGSQPETNPATMPSTRNDSSAPISRYSASLGCTDVKIANAPTAVMTAMAANRHAGGTLP